MKIKVYGKAHLSGTAKKTGRPYDFIQIHYLGKAFGVEGLAATTLSLDPKQYDYGSIQVNADYDVEFDNRGYPYIFTLSK